MSKTSCRVFASFTCCLIFSRRVWYTSRSLSISVSKNEFSASLLPVERVVANCFNVISEFQINVNTGWRSGNNYRTMLGDEYIEEFAAEISPTNIITSLHWAKSNVQFPCACHNDASSNSPKYQEVACLSMIEGTY